MDGPRIQLLASEVIDQIAAGEVIERPASVVKELVENALDAGATAVRVDIQGGGIERISVTDDGAGIVAADLPLALARHATSKLRGAAELAAIRTLGFRGEALSSIASVSRVTLTSRRAADETGTRVRARAGYIEETSAVGCPVGTTVEVADLFFNTPARRKFLRAPATEQAHAVETAVRTVLGVWRSGLVVFAGDRRLVDLPESASESQRAALALGRRVERVYEVAYERDGIRVSGHVAAPHVDRGDARGLLFYVNGRFVRDRLLQRAALEGYRSVLERGRYPVAVLRVTLAPEAVDVNVHPQKLEVRFRDGNAVFRAIAAALSEILARTPWVVDGGPHADGVRRATETFFARDGASWARETPASYVAGTAPLKAEQVPLPHVQPRGYFSRMQPVGQALGVYLVCEGTDEIVLVDQHAAHERITFERLRAEAQRGAIESQQLLFPELLAPDALTSAQLEARREVFVSLGFDLETLGPAGVAVRAVPAALAGANIRRLVEGLLDELTQLDAAGVEAEGQARREALLSRCACHASVRAGDTLGPAQVRALLVALDEVDFGAACPHGRPVYQRLSRGELERLFHRR